MSEEIVKIYLDQMLREDVAQALRNHGYDVMRASEVGQARADDYGSSQSEKIPRPKNSHC